MRRLATLTTDFGPIDGYVAAMKGVILTLAPDAQLVDVSHQVPPQHIAVGAFVVFEACRFFPQDTVHLAVVDPGVGSRRRGIVVETAAYRYVGPDNGLFSAVYQSEQVLAIAALENEDLMRPAVSATFHGRDIFAPAAGHLLHGVPVGEFGPEVTDPVRLDLWSVGEDRDVLTARVVHVDHFGNCITMLSRARIFALFGNGGCRIEVGAHAFDCFSHTYSDVAEGEPLALFGSLDTLEIAVNGGRAAQALEIGEGDVVTVRRA